MVRRILNIAWKDLLHLWHNRLLLLLVVFGAASELLLIGWATGADIDDLKTVVIDNDGTPTSRALVEALDKENTLTLDKDAAKEWKEKYDDYTSDEAIDDLFTGGFFDAPVMLIDIPPGFEEALVGGEDTEQASDVLTASGNASEEDARPVIAITLNGASSVSSTTARRAAEETIYRFGALTVSDAPDEQVLAEIDATVPAFTVKYNEDLDRAHYTTPSEAAFMLYMMAIMVAAFMLAREREYGTFEQLLVMPMRPIEIIVGKAIPAMMVGFANFVLLLGVMNVVFGVPVRGSLPLLLVLAVGYLFVELGRGFMVAMISRTQNQALLIAMLIAFVDMTFSGYAIPVESMPQVMQVLSNFFPIRHWMVILRGILQKDVGLDVFWPQLLWLAALGLVINAVTLWFFRRTLGEQR